MGDTGCRRVPPARRSYYVGLLDLTEADVGGAIIPVVPTVAEHIAQLRAEATVVDEGEFTLDGDAAREKLAEFRYSDRDRYLDPLVEGFIACGASRIELGHDLADVVVTAADVPAPPAGTLRHLFAAPFTDIRDRAGFGFSRIAVAVDMALGNRGIEQVVFEWGVGDATVVCIYGLDSKPELLRIERPSGEVKVTFDRGWKRELLAGVFDVCDPELSRIPRTTRFADVPIYVNDQRVSGQRAPITDRYRIDGDGFGLQVFYDPSFQPADSPWNHEPIALLLSQGVLVGTHRLEFDDPAPGFVAFIDLHRASYDLSQTQVREDEVILRALEAAARTRALLYDQMVMQARGGGYST